MEQASTHTRDACDVMSMAEQRPSRVRGQPARFHDKQATLHALAHAAAAESFPRLHVLADALPDSDSESEEDEEEKRGEGSAD